LRTSTLAIAFRSAVKLPRSGAARRDERRKARLARAVAPDDADTLPAEDGQRDVFEQCARTAGNRDVIEGEHAAQCTEAHCA
jgi:hypothetical protein